MVVEDNLMVREMLEHIAAELCGLSVLPGYGTLRGVQAHLRSRSQTPPDILVLDIVLPDGKGWQVLEEKPVKSGRTKVYFATGKIDQHTLSFFARRKVNGLVDKSSTRFDDWKDAFGSIAKGTSYCSPTLLPEISAILMDSEHWSKLLTPREIELLPLLSVGKTNVELGDLMKSSPGTIQVHRKNIMRKIRVNSTPELMRWAVKSGIQA
ncbi:MAG: hypothetical protein SynsKO_21620 [Synoicihabitans sp.]